MHSEASSSHPVISRSGSGALSHVYIHYPPLRCNISGSKALFYDDGNKLLLSATSDQVFSWKIAPFDPCIEPTSDAISEGPVLSVRYSLDSKVLAIQRSNHEIQFWDKERGNTFCHRCRNESEKILGFFWTDSPTSNFVLVKTRYVIKKLDNNFGKQLLIFVCRFLYNNIPHSRRGSRQQARGVWGRMCTTFPKPKRGCGLITNLITSLLSTNALLDL